VADEGVNLDDGGTVEETISVVIHVDGVVGSASIPRPTVKMSPDRTTVEKDTLGLDVADAFKLTRSSLGKVYHYELTGPDGQVIDSGVGNSLSDALFNLAVGIEDRDI
jgi:hypothetical protein